MDQEKSRDNPDAGLDLSQKWLRHLREATKTTISVPCKYCRKVFDSKTALEAHVLISHPNEVPREDKVHPQTPIEGYVLSISPSFSNPIPTSSRPRDGNNPFYIKPSNDRRSEIQQLETIISIPATGALNSMLASNPTSLTAAELKSVPASKKQAIGHGKSPSSSVKTAYSFGRRTHVEDTEQTSPKPKATRKRLFDSNSDSLFVAQTPETRPINQEKSPPDPPKIIRQPETRPITQEQLVAEVKGIYAGLVMVEGKCIQVDAKQAALAREAPAGTQPKLNNEQWQALIALHRTLLHEHHDFFLASQHPSATPAVRKLAIKYAMPARLWRHGVHSFLELLRNRLPDSLDHMLAFIYLAYSMMTLLYETVPAFEETWIECLGDLGRYRMAIEDDDIRDREVWTQVARQWYLKASGRSPETGRLYHHLAILARPNALQQLFCYYKALSVPQPFVAARESILTLFQPIVEGKQARRLPIVITAYIKVHAILFARKSQESFATTLVELSSHLDGHIGRVTQKYLEQGYYIAISNILALLGNGLPDAVLVKALSEADASEITDAGMSGTSIEADNTDAVVFEGARQLFVQTVKTNLQRVGDPNILSFIHVTMVWMVFVSYSANAMKLLEASFPWKELVTMLNTLLRFYHNYPRIEGDLLPVPDKNDFRPTPEEFALRGLSWTVRYFIPGWFRNKNIEDENQYKEDASMNTDYRPERILWLGCQLAKSGKWICYRNHRFSMPGSEQTMDTVMELAMPLELELDSGNESTTDTATLMADCDDPEVDVENMSFASRSSIGLSEKAQGQESKWEIHASSRWSSDQTTKEADAELEDPAETIGGFSRLPLDIRKWLETPLLQSEQWNLLLNPPANFPVSGQTVLVTAASRGEKDTVQLLLDCGADVDMADNGGKFALVCAAAEGHEEIVQLLLDKGANVNILNAHGQSALSLAASNGHTATVQMLLKHGANGNISFPTKSKFGALVGAARGGHESIVQALLEHTDRGPMCVTDKSILEEYDARLQRTCEKMNDYGVDITMPNAVLSYAVLEGHGGPMQLLHKLGVDDNKSIALSLAARLGHKEIVQLLLNSGADFDEAAADGVTALQRAAWEGYEEIVVLLLSKGADVDKAADNGVTALQRAAGKGHEKIVKLLLRKGADIDKTAADGVTALQRAASEGHKNIVRLLLDKGADVHKAAHNGVTALQRAAGKGHKKIVRLFLRKGAAIDKTAADGGTALIRAASEGHEKTVKLLLDKGDKGASGRAAALFVAATFGRTDIVQLLLYSTDANQSFDGQSAVAIAAKNGHKPVVELLLSRCSRSCRNQALLAAARHGHESIVQAVLDNHSADWDAYCKVGLVENDDPSEFGEASRRMLLNCQIDFTLSCMALSDAIVRGHRGVVQVMLKHSVKVNKPILATELGEERIEQLLLEGQLTRTGENKEG